MLEATKQVIKGRQKQARMFIRPQDTASSDIQESNANHQHFIEVLEKVLKVLVRCSGSELPSVALVSVDKDEESLANFANVFDALEIEADTEHTLTEPTEHPAQTKHRVVFAEEPSTEEVAWLIYCFFEDFNITRELLKDMWTTYKSGNLDLTQVALATNTVLPRISIVVRVANWKTGFRDFPKSRARFDD